MIDSDFQKDLFGGQVCEKKGRKPRLLSRYSERRFLPYVSVPIEYAVIIAIGILVLTVIAYAVGVERGRNISGISGDNKGKGKEHRIEKPRDIQQIVKTKQSEEAVEDETLAAVSCAVDNELVYKPLQEDTNEILEEKEKINDAFSILLEEDTKDKTQPLFAIQLASFKKESLAKSEVSKLEKRNIKADFTKKGEWYQVCASGYETVGSADKAKEELRKNYKDCFIRRIR
ncbi:MAG: SPOR domain-containing protein [Candidatus Omnitrophota bacterium]